jgi:hypothetical protein
MLLLTLECVCRRFFREGEKNERKMARFVHIPLREKDYQDSTATKTRSDTPEIHISRILDYSCYHGDMMTARCDRVSS